MRMVMRKRKPFDTIDMSKLDILIIYLKYHNNPSSDKVCYDTVVFSNRRENS